MCPCMHCFTSLLFANQFTIRFVTAVAAIIIAIASEHIRNALLILASKRIAWAF